MMTRHMPAIGSKRLLFSQPLANQFDLTTGVADRDLVSLTSFGSDHSPTPSLLTPRTLTQWSVFKGISFFGISMWFRLVAGICLRSPASHPNSTSYLSQKGTC